MFGVFTGSIIGGTLHSKESYLRFIERNQGTAFQNIYEAKHKLQTKVMMCLLVPDWIMLYLHSVLERLLKTVSGNYLKVNPIVRKGLANCSHCFTLNS